MSEPHPLTWDPATTERFWRWHARPSREGNYFSLQVGRGVLACLRRLDPLRGRVLDCGCGPGHFAELLIAAGATCAACDSSAEAVAGIERRLAGRAGWMGAHLAQGRLPHPDASFDLVVSLETLEHVPEPDLDGLLADLRRILVPGGRLFVSVPNAERLDDSQVFCPACGSEFHSMQHLRSFDATTLRARIERCGFTTLACASTDYGQLQAPVMRNPLRWSALYAWQRALLGAARLADALRLPGAPYGGWWLRRHTGAGPHLFWYGART